VSRYWFIRWGVALTKHMDRQAEGWTRGQTGWVSIYPW